MPAIPHRDGLVEMQLVAVWIAAGARNGDPRRFDIRRE
jgi:hypothetical protein